MAVPHLPPFPGLLNPWLMHTASQTASGSTLLRSVRDDRRDPYSSSDRNIFTLFLRLLASLDPASTPRQHLRRF